jgi:Asp-tRNA(Asn)/Glu-tRNA(Gln) amidotransferase B subunit
MVDLEKQRAAAEIELNKNLKQAGGIENDQEFLFGEGDIAQTLEDIEDYAQQQNIDFDAIMENPGLTEAQKIQEMQKIIAKAIENNQKEAEAEDEKK